MPWLLGPAHMTFGQAFPMSLSSLFSLDQKYTPWSGLTSLSLNVSATPVLGWWPRSAACSSKSDGCWNVLTHRRQDHDLFFFFDKL